MDEQHFDAIVIGSGIGGLTAGAALAKHGRRVLVLEQHTQLGGLTQTFTRREYRFAVGVHYIGGVADVPGPAGEFGRLLAWLSDGRIRFAPIGSPFDIVRLPGCEFPIEAPRTKLLERLKRAFPAEASAIERYFAACDDAKRTSRLLFAAKGVPRPLAAWLRWTHAVRIRRSLLVSVDEMLGDIEDRTLAAILASRWGDYGLPPGRAPFLVHATVLGSFDDGAYYPVGGPAVFAAALGETITRAGGELRTQAQVRAIRVEGGRAVGVRLANGECLDAPVVISDMGARNTVAALPQDAASAWRDAIARLASSTSYVSLYLGLRGDIRAHGASAANVWIYETPDVGRLWRQPSEEDAPSLFVSFPTLKDPAHTDPEHHSVEVTAFCLWQAFAPWAASSPGRRPEGYEATKAWIGETLLAQFKRHFPRLAPLVEFHEVSTPLSQAFFDVAHEGAAYGIELSAARLARPTLRTRTPVPGLLLAGQDAASLGVQGASLGGFMAAAAAVPALWREMRA